MCLGDELEELDQVGVFDVRQGAELALETIEIDAAGQVQRLERDLAPELPVKDQVHAPHAAAAQQADGLKQEVPGKYMGRRREDLKA